MADNKTCCADYVITQPSSQRDIRPRIQQTICVASACNHWHRHYGGRVREIGPRPLRRLEILVPQSLHATSMSSKELSVHWLPISKRKALRNPTKAQNLFDERIKALPKDTVKIFTDGSAKDDVYTAAIYSAGINLAIAWKVKGARSSFTSELYALKQGFEAAYHQNEVSQLVNVISDSKPPFST